MAGQIVERPRSILDTDLYKLTMQYCVLKYFPTVVCTHRLSNRTPSMKFTREAADWLQSEINGLVDVRLRREEREFLEKKCQYLKKEYLDFLQDYRFQPSADVVLQFKPDAGQDGVEESKQKGELVLETRGLWVQTILYEIPLLALVTEAYFKFVSTDWSYDGQFELAKDKGLRLMRGGCNFSEFATRRRRDFNTQDIVISALVEAAAEVKQEALASANQAKYGTLVGTSNLHLARVYGLTPIGTIAHELFMGVAALTNNYEHANELTLRCWINTFGVGVLPIALSDTFGTSAFLTEFRKKISPEGGKSQLARPASSGSSDGGDLKRTKSTLSDEQESQVDAFMVRLLAECPESDLTFAEAFLGVRQDSGDPVAFVQTMKEFYEREGIDRSTKTIVFSDALKVDRCLAYKAAAEQAGFIASFGIGTHLTNDFVNLTSGEPSTPLNVVFKLSAAEDRPAVKLSDNSGKYTGDRTVIEDVKQRLEYVYAEWKEGDEARRWAR